MNSFLNSDIIIIIFDVIVLLLGAYLIYSAIKMKKTDTIPSILLSPSETTRCQNPYDFIDYMFPYVLSFGCVCVAYGVFSILADTVLKLPRIYDGLAVVILLGVWFYFSMILRRAKDKYM